MNRVCTLNQAVRSFRILPSYGRSQQIRLKLKKRKGRGGGGRRGVLWSGMRKGVRISSLFMLVNKEIKIHIFTLPGKFRLIHGNLVNERKGILSSGMRVRLEHLQLCRHISESPGICDRINSLDPIRAYSRGQKSSEFCR